MHTMASEARDGNSAYMVIIDIQLLLKLNVIHSRERLVLM